MKRQYLLAAMTLWLVLFQGLVVFGAVPDTSSSRRVRLHSFLHGYYGSGFQGQHDRDLNLGLELSAEQRISDRVAWRIGLQPWPFPLDRYPSGTWEDFVSEAKVRVCLPLAHNRWVFSLGRYRTPMGVEGFDPRGWSFGAPSELNRRYPNSLTGLMLEGPLSRSVNVALFVDAAPLGGAPREYNATAERQHASYSVGTTIRYRPLPSLELGLAMLQGVPGHENYHSATLCYRATEKLTLSAEGMWGRIWERWYTYGHSWSPKAHGYLISLTRQMNRKLTLGLRYDRFEHEFDYRSGTEVGWMPDPQWGHAKDTASNLTLSTSVKLQPSLRGFFDVRYQTGTRVTERYAGSDRPGLFRDRDGGLGGGIGFTFSF